MSFDYTVGVSLCALSLATLYWRANANKFPLPPGPPRWPLVGSLFSMPKDSETRQTLTKWGEQYGRVSPRPYPHDLTSFSR
jgi:hypothetical protein